MLSPEGEELLIDYREDGVENVGKPPAGEENHYVTVYEKDFGHASLSQSPERKAAEEARLVVEEAERLAEEEREREEEELAEAEEKK